MSKISSSETVIEGQWHRDPEGSWIPDAVCQRIKSLISTNLQKVAVAANGWEILYRDAQDGRYWELTYPHSELHGGGPPKLVVASVQTCREKYKVTPDSYKSAQ
jgi:hypothetical protein